MKNKLLTILFFKLFASFSFAQTLFDDAVLANIYVNIDPDTLAYIYENPTLDIYFPAQFIFQQGSVSDTVEQIGFRLRGNSSRFSAKKSFKISFNTFVTGRRYQGVKKINLNGEHNDPTLIREKLFYDIWHTADMPERRTRFAKLFINNNYNGLYTLLEEFDKDWLERVFNEQDGNLYKCTYPADLEYINENQQTYKDIVGAGDARAYDLKTNETEDDYSGLVHLITILNQPPNDAFVDSIQTILEVNNTLKALAIDVATGNWDDYAYNRNNYYLYQNATTNKFTFITYDPDNCAGVDFVGADWSMRDCLNWLHPSNPRPLMSKLLAIPQFKNQYILYLDSITQYITHQDSIFPIIDLYKNMVADAALNDPYRPLDWGFDENDFWDSFNSPVHQYVPIGLKPFFAIRDSATLAQIEGMTNTVSALAASTLQIFPNPTQDVIYINASENDNYIIEIRLTNIIGQSILQKTIAPQQTTYTLPVQHLPKGVYFVTVEFEHQQSITKKIIKE